MIGTIVFWIVVMLGVTLFFAVMFAGWSAAFPPPNPPELRRPPARLQDYMPPTHREE